MSGANEGQLNVLVGCPAGTRIWFAEEKAPYRVRSRSERYLVCTKPFNPQRTVLYTIVDLERLVRGPEGLVFGMGAESDQDCEDMISRLTDPHDPTFVSRRNSIPVFVTKIETPNARPVRPAPAGTHEAVVGADQSTGGK